MAIHERSMATAVTPAATGGQWIATSACGLLAMTEWDDTGAATRHRGPATRDTVTNEAVVSDRATTGTVIARPKGPWRSIDAREMTAMAIADRGPQRISP